MFVSFAAIAQNSNDEEFNALAEFLQDGHFASPAAVRLYAVSSVVEVGVVAYGDVQQQVNVNKTVEVVGFSAGVTTAVSQALLDFEVYNPAAANVHFGVQCRNSEGRSVLHGHDIAQPVRQPGGVGWYFPSPSPELYMNDIRIPVPVHKIGRAYIQRTNGQRIGLGTNEGGWLYLSPYDAGPGQLVVEAYDGTVVFDLETGEIIPSIQCTTSINPTINHVTKRLVRDIDLVFDPAGLVVSLDLENDPGRYIDPRKGYVELRVESEEEHIHIFARMRAKSGHQPNVIGIRENGTGPVQYRELSSDDIVNGLVYLGVFAPGHYQVLGVYPELSQSSNPGKG